METLNYCMLVEKEEISKSIFPKEEVLQIPEQITARRNKLEKGMILGNNYKHKVKIVFEDNECVKEVETTIWATMERNVFIKGGTLIPIHRIHDVII